MHAKPVEDRADAIETKETMLGRQSLHGVPVKSTAVQGGEGPAWREGGHEVSKHDVNR